MLEKERFLAIKKLAHDIREDNKKIEKLKFSVTDKIYIHGVFLFKKTICRDSRQKIGSNFVPKEPKKT